MTKFKYKIKGKLIEWSIKTDGRPPSVLRKGRSHEADFTHPLSFVNLELHSDKKNLPTSWEEITVCNNVTRAICEILANPKHIINNCGSACPAWYYAKLIGQLDSLWE